MSHHLLQSLGPMIIAASSWAVLLVGVPVGASADPEQSPSYLYAIATWHYAGSYMASTAAEIKKHDVKLVVVQAVEKEDLDGLVTEIGAIGGGSFAYHLGRSGSDGQIAILYDRDVVELMGKCEGNNRGGGRKVEMAEIFQQEPLYAHVAFKDGDIRLTDLLIVGVHLSGDIGDFAAHEAAIAAIRKELAKVLHTGRVDDDDPECVLRPELDQAILGDFNESPAAVGLFLREADATLLVPKRDPLHRDGRETEGVWEVFSFRRSDDVEIIHSPSDLILIKKSTGSGKGTGKPLDVKDPIRTSEAGVDDQCDLHSSMCRPLILPITVEPDDDKAQQPSTKSALALMRNMVSTALGDDEDELSPGEATRSNTIWRNTAAEE